MTEATVGRRRGRDKASITCIGAMVTNLEADATVVNKGNKAKLLLTKLNKVSYT